MVAAYHLIWTAYGWWLPNDPRGSTSHGFRSAKIAGLGELHCGRKRIQPAYRDLEEFYERARGVLKHDLLRFDDTETALIANSFEQAIASRRYTCYACAIMQDHVHMLLRKHRDKAEQMIEQLQRAASETLRAAGRRDADHPVWGGPGWKVFLETPADIWRTIKYIRNNPIRARQSAQRWSFVERYDGWLPARVVGRSKSQADTSRHRKRK